MTNESRLQLKQELIEDEGLSLKPYKCTAGKLTIGVGRNFDDVGISNDEAMLLLDHDIQSVERDAMSNFAWYHSLNETRKRVVLNMIFNLGITRFKNFKNMISYLAVGRFDKASEEMLDSRWRHQVGNRALRLARRMANGY